MILTTSGELSADAIAAAVSRVVDPGCFFAKPGCTLTVRFVAEETVPWEIFRGRLLDPNQCFEERRFTSWHVVFDARALNEIGPSDQQSADHEPRPLESTVAVFWDREAGDIFMTRFILAHVWEGYDAGDNVILSREVTRWVRELIAAIHIHEFASIQDLEAEIACQLFLAVIGTSRLPLTSTEAPLPAFTLGQLGYFREPAASGQPCTDALHFLQPHRTWHELARLLELVLRCDEAPAPQWVADFVARWQSMGRANVELAPLLRTMFNEVSLSPWTSFTSNALTFLRELAAAGHISRAEQVDFLGFILRQLGRHLTAYDLITFHYRGANYPDALLLDAVLREYVQLIDAHFDLFADNDRSARIRRRGLRQACLLRRYYVGHLVPDVPTSPGENARVLPAPHQRVPEEQILQAMKRNRQLFVDEPLETLLSPAAKQVLRQGMVDLEHDAELRELGIAVFIDRPLGFAKLPGEPDQTQLFAHEAFSPSIACRRLEELVRLSVALQLDPPVITDHEQRLTHVAGLPMRIIWSADRPTVALTDARRVADDFVVLRTLPNTVRRFLTSFDFTAVAGMDLNFLREGKAIIVLLRPATLGIFDLALQKRLEVEIDVAAGYRQRGGTEWPAAGLRTTSGERLAPKLSSNNGHYS